ncbi:hypothetical protein D3C85_1128510 [compost metagenome]
MSFKLALAAKPSLYLENTIIAVALLPVKYFDNALLEKLPAPLAATILWAKEAFTTSVESKTL